jgi:CheY-like chemotaxis protein
VLLVEDHPDVRMLIALALTTHHFDVREAGDGAEALRMLAAEPRPDLIITDLTMPVMDGWDLLTALHEDPALASIPVIVLSARDDPNRDVPRPSTILIKPVRTDVLLDAIRDALASRS